MSNSKYTDLEKLTDIETFKNSVCEYFNTVTDPRVKDNQRYPFLSVIIIMLMAVVSGANSILAIFDYAQAKKDLIKEYLEMDTIPRYTVFWWILTRMNPKEFASAFQDWIEDVRVKNLTNKTINIDGKCLRGAHNKNGKQNVHIVTAWSNQEGLVLAQLKAEEKSNEITAIPNLLKMIDIKGATITIDAAGCQKNILNQIHNDGGYYIVAVKENQPLLYSEVIQDFEAAHEQNFYYVPNADIYKNIEKSHARIESRQIAICGNKLDFSDNIKNHWSSIETFIEVTSERETNGNKTIEKRYYVSNKIAEAKTFAHNIRGHWSIENSFHWKLDVVFREDESRANTLHAAENLATLRRIALVYLNQNNQKKLNTAQKRRRAGWDDSIVKEMLGSIFGLYGQIK